MCDIFVKIGLLPLIQSLKCRYLVGGVSDPALRMVPTINNNLLSTHGRGAQEWCVDYQGS